MKIFFLLALLATASIAHSKDLKVKETFDGKKEINKKAKAQRCTQYGMVAWCKKNDMVIDTVCWDDAVSGSYEQSRACIRENGDLYNIFMCGSSSYMGLTQTIY